MACVNKGEAMKAHIVLAHPESQSFNAELAPPWWTRDQSAGTS